MWVSSRVLECMDINRSFLGWFWGLPLCIHLTEVRRFTRMNSGGRWDSGVLGLLLIGTWMNSGGRWDSEVLVLQRIGTWMNSGVSPDWNRGVDEIVGSLSFCLSAPEWIQVLEICGCNTRLITNTRLKPGVSRNLTMWTSTVLTVLVHLILMQ